MGRAEAAEAPVSGRITEAVVAIATTTTTEAITMGTTPQATTPADITVSIQAVRHTLDARRGEEAVEVLQCTQPCCTVYRSQADCPNPYACLTMHQCTHKSVPGRAVQCIDV